LTCAILKAAVLLAHQKVVNSDWDFKALGAFLSAHSLNGESITTALGHARNAKKLRKAEKQNEETEEFQRLKDRKEECPDQFEPWKGPAAWQCEGVELDDHIDAIVHLLFLGIVKSTLQHTVEWLKLKKKFSSFNRVVKDLLEAVDLLKLGFCKTQPWRSGTFGSWVSENYLGFACVSKWFFPISWISAQIHLMKFLQASHIIGKQVN